MTIVVGKIEPLKKLKEILNNNGITRFNSIGEINAFLKNYESEKVEIPKITKIKLDQEIQELEETTKQAVEKSNKNVFNKIVYYLKIKSLTNKKSKIENNYENVLSRRCKESYKVLGFTKEVNETNNVLIKKRINELKEAIPEKNCIFDDYYQNQLIGSEILDKYIKCVTYVLK